jgi:chemotaxis protein CheZ
MDVLNELGTVDEGEGPLASISRDLDEIRDATQDAAAKFLACAENIEELSDRPDIDPDDQTVLMQVSTDIFEASAFQDLTGQRLTRIAEFLRQIEYYFASTKAALGDEEAAEIANSLSDTVEQMENRKVEYILHGPQDAGTANSQEEIDKILASFD